MSKYPEKYNFEEAEEEAARMQDKIKSGDAEDYAGAEKLVEQEKEEGKIVDAIKISTIFSDYKILEKIADNFLSKGLISGFHIDKARSGYIYDGKRIKEDQYSLEILLDSKTGDEVKAEIKETIENTIGEKWDIPAIEEEQVKINEKLLGFIKRAEIEHDKYIRERSFKLAIALAALISILVTIGTFTKRHYEKKEQKAVAAEQMKSRQRIYKLEEKIARQVAELDAQIVAGQPLTVIPIDMSATDAAYEETNEILETIREVENEMRKLSQE